MKKLTGVLGSLILLGFALPSAALTTDATSSQTEIKSFTVANSGGGGFRSGRGDRSRGFDRARSRQRDSNPSSGFGRSDEGLSSPDADDFRMDNPDPDNIRRSLE